VLASLIRGASTHHSLIVGTQSTSLINYFQPEDIVVVSRSNGQSDFERQNSQSLATWLKEYAIGEDSSPQLDWWYPLPVTRLYVISEGLTESNFVRDILAPHVESVWPDRLTVQAPNLRGHCTCAELKKLIRALLGNPEGAVLVTTMIDLFKLPQDFPGSVVCDDYEDPWKRVEAMERFFYEDIQDRGSYLICSFTSSKR